MGVGSSKKLAPIAQLRGFRPSRTPLRAARCGPPLAGRGAQSKFTSRTDAFSRSARTQRTAIRDRRSAKLAGLRSVALSILSTEMPSVGLVESTALSRSPPRCRHVGLDPQRYRAAIQASLQTKISSRLALGIFMCSSTAIRSCSGKRRMIAATLRHSPDRARVNARSTAADLVIADA